MKIFLLLLSFSRISEAFRLPRATRGDERIVFSAGRRKSIVSTSLQLQAPHHADSFLRLPKERLPILRGGAAVAAVATSAGGGSSLKVTSWIGTALICALSYGEFDGRYLTIPCFLPTNPNTTHTRLSSTLQSLYQKGICFHRSHSRRGAFAVCCRSFGNIALLGQTIIAVAN